MLDEKQAETDRLFTELAADDRVRLGRAVPLREQQVDDLEDRRKARRERIDRRRVELRDLLAQRGARPLQALVDRVLILEQPQRDLVDAEPAECLQREDDLRLARDRRIATDEEHPELGVLHFVLSRKTTAASARRRRQAHRCSALSRRGPDSLFAPERAEHFVHRDAEQPGALVVGRPLLRPRLHGAEQRGLDRVFAQLQPVHAEPA